MILLWLQLVEFVHRISLDVVGYVYVWFHSLVVAVPRPFHHHLCGDAQCQSVTDECPSSGMGSQQSVFGCDGVYAFVSLVVGFPYRIVDFRKFSQFFQIIVHLLIADDRKCLMVFKVHAFVFFQYRLAVVVQLYDKAVRSLDGGHFYMVGLDVAPFEVVHV